MAVPPSARLSSGKTLRLLLRVAAVILVAAGLAYRLFPRPAPGPAAFLAAVDGSSRFSFGWRNYALRTTRALPAAKPVKIPAGSRVKLIHPDGGAELIVGPAELQLPALAPSEPDHFLSPLSEFLASAKLDNESASSGVVVTSPVGVTRFLNPTLTWIARPGATYNVAVRDPAEPDAPVRIARVVQPPIALAQLITPQRRELLADRIYEIIVGETGSDTVIGGARFLTTPDAAGDTSLPSDPADLLAEATAAMAKKPTRTGDAWLALKKLPPAWAASELALRLRIRVAAELNLPGEFASALAAAQKLEKKRG
jgi:hypothetical protein